MVIFEKMVQMKTSFPTSWQQEDLEFLQTNLARTFPQIGPTLRRAIVMLSMDEVSPRAGRKALHECATNFARHCPVDSGLEPVILS